jgi:PKD repeat protein
MVTPMAHQKRKTNVGIFAVLALVGAALLSGCAGVSDSEEGNWAPSAELAADKTEGYVGEQFTFDAQASSDPDGNVTQWRFDFGDGTQTTVTDEDAARVKHVYADGGEYIATVTVVDDGTGDGLGEKTDEEAVHISIDERMPVAASVVRTPLDSDAGSMMELPFEAREGADRATANLTLQNTLVSGSSEVLLRVHAPDGSVIEEESYLLGSTDPMEVEFSTLLTDVGKHTLEVVAKSGAARVTGELLVIYSDAPDVDKLEDQADDES